MGPQEALVKEKPDYHDAELVLKVYEMRREPTMREARKAILASFWPDSAADVMAVMQGSHPLNTAWRQTSSFWEMVYGMVKHEIVHGDYFMESNGEGLILFGKLQPYLEELRKTSPTMLQNAEWVATHTETGRRTLALFLARLPKMREAMAPKPV